ncbi:beta-glucosidase 12-like [Cornus florida]|uniref:beta-glucosidase 12-like n=1 Tax=Cornus florida TaxID=4283 RepID=UPI00289EACC1|nr:beta-glucosidase 12-like [Cornus florida]
MAIQAHVLLVLLVIAEAVVTSSALSVTHGLDKLNRSSFPAGFVFGAASSAYQIEGGVDSKGKSIWDTFTHKYPEKIKDGSNGDVAVDSYHRYKEDVALLKEMNLDAYRFSIAWSRVLPTGKLSGGVNEEGIQYYNNLINELLANGLKPYVTLFHWDLPQGLDTDYGGFLSSKIVNDFHDYAKLCFERFGDRVKNWATFNEPWSYSTAGYTSGAFAPGRCSSWLENNCTGGDSGIEPYIVTHNQILAHAAAVSLYKSNYQALQRGKIGIVLVSTWNVPYSNSTNDRLASLRALDFMLGWFMDPLINGNYPQTMRSLVRQRLPRFTVAESNSVKGSYDYIGLNYYTAYYTAHLLGATLNVSYTTDSRATLSADRNGTFIGEPAGSDWLYVYPRGIWDLLLYIKRKYNNPPIMIMENGVDEVNNATLTVEQALVDNFRIKYYLRHLLFVNRAVRDGVNLLGYFSWSILDNFEWASGYTVRFGINYVDYNDGLKRYKKNSARWFENFLKK